jgi:hypothetical protein
VGDRYPSSRVPCGLGTGPPFYRPKREQFTCVPHYFPTCGGVVCSATELTAVLANPTPVEASWRVQCSYRSGFEGGGVVVGRSATAADRFEGAVNGGPYAAQWRRGDVLSPCTPAASGMSSQCMVWRCSGGDGRTELTATRETAPAGLTSRRSLA